MTQGEQDFVEQFARVLLVQWCAQTLSTSGHITDVTNAGSYKVQGSVADLCLAHAKEKGWVGKSDPPKVVAKGFSTAAAFLKR